MVVNINGQFDELWNHLHKEIFTLDLSVGRFMGNCLDLTD